MYVRFGQPPRALEIARAMPDRDAGTLALSTIARSLLYRGDRAASVGLLAEVRQRSRWAGSAMQRRAVELHAAIGGHEQIARLLALPEYAAQGALARSALAIAAAARGDLARAEALLAQAPAPSRPELGLSLSESAASAGQRGPARRLLAQAFETGRLNAVELLRTAALARRLKDTALGLAAIEQYATRAARDKVSAYGMLDYGLAAYRLGMVEIAEEVVEGALAEIRQERMAVRASRLPYLAYALGEMQRKGAARDVLREAIQAAGAGEARRKPVLIRVAKMFAGMGEEHEARAIVAAYPTADRAEVLMFVADHALRSGDHLGGGQLLVEIAGHMSDVTDARARARAQRQLAERFYRANDNPGAVGLLDQCLLSIARIPPAERAPQLVKLIQTIFQIRLAPSVHPELTGRSLID